MEKEQQSQYIYCLLAVESGVLILSGASDVILPMAGDHPAICSMVARVLSQGGKYLATQLHLAPRLNMSEAISVGNFKTAPHTDFSSLPSFCSVVSQCVSC